MNSIEIVKVPTDKWTEYQLAKKWYQVTKHVYEKSRNYAFGKHYCVKKKPLLYLTNANYESCIQLAHVMYRYDELTNDLAMSHNSQINIQNIQNKKIIQNGFKQARKAIPITIIYDKHVVGFLRRKALDADTFNNAYRVFDYYIKYVLKQCLKHNIAMITFLIIGKKPSKHNIYDSRQLRYTTIGKNGVKSKLKFIPEIDNSKHAQDVLAPDAKPFTNPSKVVSVYKKAEINHILTFQETQHSIELLYDNRVFRALPNESMYNVVRRRDQRNAQNDI